MIRTNAIVIRHAEAADLPVLARLAALDSAPMVSVNALIAELDGVAVAALDLDDGRVVADPFTPSIDLVDLLKLRARRLAAVHEPKARRAGLRLRRPQRAIVARA
jgi:hypothetical protein